MNNSNFLYPEWDKQDAILLSFPHSDSDWREMLEEVSDCYFQIIENIIMFDEDVILIVPDNIETEEFNKNDARQIHLVNIPTNDTWTRDYGPIFVIKNNIPKCLDFKFNGWGLKFASDKDNLVNNKLLSSGIFSEQTEYNNRLNFVFEGGSIDTDGNGTLLTTAKCLLSPNRNGQWNKSQIESYLKEELGVRQILWLNNGVLSGDDTDSHVDTLARFVNLQTIAYVKCTNPNDEHYQSLKAMEDELKTFKNIDNQPYKLVALPFPEPIYSDGYRLPATYANFLIINKAVLVPTYNVPQDEEALKIFENLFADRKIVGINCRSLIEQHGSLHCATMQLPYGSTIFCREQLNG